MTHSRGSVTRAKMNAPFIILFCCIIGSVVSYNVQRQLPYNLGPNDPYTAQFNSNSGFEPSQRIFWGGGGSNQVGGNGGLWSKITNKFPFLENMFGRMELPAHYGVPNIQQQYEAPISQQYALPGSYEPQFYQGQYRQQFLPSGRNVAFTDDAVIVTPPHVPIVPQPIQPVPAPVPAPEPTPGYHYSKPQHRLELPRK